MNWYKSYIFKEARFFFDQTFSDETGTWRVPDLHEYAVENGKKVSIPISKLMNNLEPSDHERGEDLPGHPLFIIRANDADLKFPILVVEYPDGLWIADGVHRLWKAKQKKRKNIDAYLIKNDELKKITQENPNKIPMRTIKIKGVDYTGRFIQDIKDEFNVISLRTYTDPIPTETICYSLIDEHMEEQFLCVETFDDVDSTESKFFAPKPDQVKRILEWAALKAKENDRPFLVHCTAGISRSSAIAILISQMINGRFHHIFNPMIHDPNELVIHYGEQFTGLAVSENITRQKRRVARDNALLL